MPIKRQRKVPHVEGNFSTLVYLPLGKHALTKIQKIQHFYKSTTNLEDNVLMPLTLYDSSSGNLKHAVTNSNSSDGINAHISLSQNVYVKSFQLEHFVKDIIEIFTSNVIEPFTVLLRSTPLVGFMENFNNVSQSSKKILSSNGTGCFMGIEVDRNATTVFNLIKKLNSIMDMYGYPRYYDPPRPHVSLFYSAHQQEDIHQTLPKLNDESIPSDVCCLIKRICIRVGKCNISVPLGTASSLISDLKNSWPFEKILYFQHHNRIDDENISNSSSSSSSSE